jgi:HlyD family secretion protein
LEDAQEKVDSISFQRASDNLILQTQANTDLARKEVALAADNYHRYEHRPDGDSTKATALLRLTTARQNLTDLVNLYNWYTGKPTELDKETYYADLAFAKSDLADAQREYDRLAGGPPESDIAAAKARITAAQSTINMGKIISPFDGVVTQVDAMAGDLINQGVFAIRVDDTSKLLVDLQISEVDVNSLKVDQEVTVSFDAVQGKTYLGKVQQISQYGSSTGTGVNFDVTVELTDNDEFIKPGMTAAVTITVKDIKSALFVQNRAVRNVNGQRVVYVLKDGIALPVEIRLGATADTVSEVVGGELVEGDLIILNPPSTDQGMFGG